jgi:23S rRNA (pseudouridine1915-N3)-methyltransferase
VKLRLIIVGRDRNDPIVQAADEYVERIRRYFPIEVVEVKEEPLRKGTPIDRVKRAEAERIQNALKEGEHLVLLDEHGKQHTSEEVAKRLSTFSRDGIGNIAFVVGGPVGLDPEFLRTAKEKWSLSKMTLPHRIARLILAEQLYRACTILRGEPYHK